jgi:anthranilate phosphoribosyltransferase
MIRECLVKLSQKQSLTEANAYGATLEILEGHATPAQIAGYLSFLSYKSETADEVIGSVKAMREKMVRINAEGLDAIDVCGTGGDHQGTFNISTTAAFVLAGGGVTVAKHGNRAASSQCGSAEVLENLGVKLEPSSSIVEKCLKEARIAFLFAPHYHPAMKNVGPIRKELGVRTIFNILGPMCNPASVRRQVIGVFSQEKAKLMAEVLTKLGSEKIITLHSAEGLDEVSCAGPTTLFENGKDQTIRQTEISPETFGFSRHPLESLRGSDAAGNAMTLTAILNGEKGPKRDAVLMNAAVGFYAAGKCASFAEGCSLGAASIDSGAALKALQTLAKVSHS